MKPVQQQLYAIAGPVSHEAERFKLAMTAREPDAWGFQLWTGRVVLAAILKTRSFALSAWEAMPLPAGFLSAMNGIVAAAQAAQDAARTEPLTETEVFLEWLARVVLPAIRKTGAFELADGETVPLPKPKVPTHGATLDSAGQPLWLH